MNKLKKTTIDSKDFENIDKDLLYLRLEKKELECLNRKTMTRKEQIMRIFKDYSVTHGGLTEVADAIIALPIDVPGDEEIIKQSRIEYPYYDTDWNATTIQRHAWRKCATWMRDEILKRNRP